MQEDLTFSNLNDCLQSENPFIKHKISVEIAAPFIPIIGINMRLDNKPKNNAIKHHLNTSFSFPDIARIVLDEPNKDWKKGLSKIIKKVILEIKKSGPKNTLTNFS